MNGVIIQFRRRTQIRINHLPYCRGPVFEFGWPIVSGGIPNNSISERGFTWEFNEGRVSSNFFEARVKSSCLRRFSRTIQTFNYNEWSTAWFTGHNVNGIVQISYPSTAYFRFNKDFSFDGNSGRVQSHDLFPLEVFSRGHFLTKQWRNTEGNDKRHRILMNPHLAR